MTTIVTRASKGAALSWAEMDANLTNLNDALLETINVKNYGVLGNGVTDDLSAINICLAANPGRRIYFPHGTYLVSGPITITSNSTHIVGDGVGVTNFKPSADNGDLFQFQPSVTTDGSWLYNCSLSEVSIYDTDAARTTGACVRLTMCNGFHLRDVYMLDFPEGLVVAGGQLNSLEHFWIYASALTGTVADSAAMRFTNQASGAGHQQVFSTQVSNFFVGDTKHFADGILLEGCDGLSFTNGYVSRTSDYLVKIKPNVSGKHVSSVSFSGVYLDGNNATTGTTNGIGILDDGFSGASSVALVSLDPTCTIGNLTGKGLYSTHPSIFSCTFDTEQFINVAGAEIDVTGGMTTGFIGIWVPWTPAATFATPGDLSIAYTTQIGSYRRDSSGATTAKFNILTSTFTHTTASGRLKLTGLPITPGASTPGSIGSCYFQGITKAGYTQIVSSIGAGDASIYINASGSGQAVATVVAADCPTGGNQLLQGQVTFDTGEVY